MITQLFLVFFLLVILIEIVGLISFSRNYKEASPIQSIQQWPTVSVLIAARNEEENLPLCLASLEKMDYPLANLQVLIGNDDSTDSTQAVIDQWTDRLPYLHSVSIQPNIHGLIAKSNVLAQLAQKSKGDFFVILDADVSVSKNWLKGMVAQALQGFDLVSGYTEVKCEPYFSNLQKMDWQCSLHSLKVLADLEKPLTALGNNMLVSRKAYLTLGGFEALGSTRVEDLKMQVRMQEMGFKAFQIVGKNFATTEPIKGLSAYLQQRKRWLSGVLKYRPFQGIGFVLLRLLMVEMLCVLLFLSNSKQVMLLLLLLIIKWLVENFKHFQMERSLKRANIKFSLTTPFIISLLDTFALVMLMLNPSIRWKKRKVDR